MSALNRCSSAFNESAVVTPYSGFGNGAWNTSDGNGPKPILYGATLPVSAIPIIVRQWKPPVNPMTPGRPVAARAILIALAQCLDRNSDQPLYRQLHRLLQKAILSKELSAGTRLPPSRLLAQELGLGRNTVTQVYEQLALEGHVWSATGRGTFVADTSPDEIDGEIDNVVDRGDKSGTSPRIRGRTEVGDRPSRPSPRVLSARGERLLAGVGVSKRQWGAFMPGVPDAGRARCHAFPGACVDSSTQ